MSKNCIRVIGKAGLNEFERNKEEKLVSKSFCKISSTNFNLAAELKKGSTKLPIWWSNFY